MTQAQAAPGRRPNGRLRWQTATLVARRRETRTADTLVLRLPVWSGHLPGQHVDVRLTAPDGYSTQRSYSIASAPDGELIELTVQRVEDGEVSPYLVDELRVGDQIELRGPVGGWFVWRPADNASVLLVAGGSGIVPLMAMLRVRARVDDPPPFRLVYSVRTPEDRLYQSELDEAAPGLDLTYVYTRSTPAGWPREPGRLIKADLLTEQEHWSAKREPTCYVCGPTAFVETAANLLTALGHDPGRVRTERFG